MVKIDINRCYDWRNHGYWINPGSNLVVNPVKVIVTGYQVYSNISMREPEVELRYRYKGEADSASRWLNSGYFYRTRNEAVEAAVLDLEKRAADGIGYDIHGPEIGPMMSRLYAYLAVSGKNAAFKPGVYYVVAARPSVVLCSVSSDICSTGNWFSRHPYKHAGLFASPKAAFIRLKEELKNLPGDRSMWAVHSAKLTSKGQLLVNYGDALSEEEIREFEKENKKKRAVPRVNSLNRGYLVRRKQDGAILGQYLQSVESIKDVVIYETEDEAEDAIFNNTKLQLDYEVVAVGVVIKPV